MIPENQFSSNWVATDCPQTRLDSFQCTAGAPGIACSWSCFFLSFLCSDMASPRGALFVLCENLLYHAGVFIIPAPHDIDGTTLVFLLFQRFQNTTEVQRAAMPHRAFLFSQGIIWHEQITVRSANILNGSKSAAEPPPVISYAVILLFYSNSASSSLDLCFGTH